MYYMYYGGAGLFLCSFSAYDKPRSYNCDQNYDFRPRVAQGAMDIKIVYTPCYNFA